MVAAVSVAAAAAVVYHQMAIAVACRVTHAIGQSGMGTYRDQRGVCARTS